VPELLNPSAIRSLLTDHRLHPSKALGQHFLADANTARRIVRLAELEPAQPVVEIGPGLGSLTLALCAAGHRVRAVELDRHIRPVLADVVAGDDCDVDIVAGDALVVDWPKLLRDGTSWAMVANLPYNVATAVLVRALEQALEIERFLVMVQREVGERLAAPPGSKTYGAVSVKVAYYGRAKVVGVVPSSVFIPRPNVESALVRVIRHAAPPVSVPDPQRMFAIVQAGFATRRKTLRQSLRSVFGERTGAVLDAAGIDPMERAEQLDLAEWAALTHAEIAVL
jgi:16S rRNA (adenine1518-N6/adenine1519-N6)-dimethyltransferase